LDVRYGMWCSILKTRRGNFGRHDVEQLAQASYSLHSISHASSLGVHVTHEEV
jgi:hypothetical protein